VKQAVTKPIVVSFGFVAFVVLAGALWLAVTRADGMVIDLAALAGLAICF
jgi:hypothetical protein